MGIGIVAEFQKGGVAMYPLLALSILAVSIIFERLWFWLRILNQERTIVNRVLNAAQTDWGEAREIARNATDQPIGRFLFAPLSLPSADLETFRLALEATAEEELAGMRRGEKLLEAIIGLAPLLGLFGTVWGLITSLRAIRIEDLGTEAAAGVSTGIGESLISTAAGLVVAIISLAFYRLFQTLLFNQVRVFRKAGNDIELLFRQFPPSADFSQNRGTVLPASPPSKPQPPKRRGKLKFGEPYDNPTDTTNSESENN